MKPYLILSLGAGLLVLSFTGCGQKTGKPEAASTSPSPTPNVAASEQSEEETEIAAVLAKLSPADRKLAESQRFCVVMNDSRLGSMGAPVKLLIKDQPVFLCCKGCQKKALADPDKTLAKAEQLKKKTEEESAKQ